MGNAQPSKLGPVNRHFRGPWEQKHDIITISCLYLNSTPVGDSKLAVGDDDDVSLGVAKVRHVQEA